MALHWQPTLSLHSRFLEVIFRDQTIEAHVIALDITQFPPMGIVLFCTPTHAVGERNEDVEVFELPPT